MIGMLITPTTFLLTSHSNLIICIFFRWDEWVDDTRILKYNDENKEIQTQIRAEYRRNKNSKRKEKKGMYIFLYVLLVTNQIIRCKYKAWKEEERVWLWIARTSNYLLLLLFHELM